MDPLLLSKKIRLCLGKCISGTPVIKDGYCEVWYMSGSTRVLIHLYDDGKVVATTSSGNLWVFDQLESVSQTVLSDPDLEAVY
jgi:hypothetical protein